MERKMKLKPAVYLVGAGPGDPALLTQRALECIQQADCIVYDRLMNVALLDHARPDCERIYVGKAAGQHTLPQEQIQALLVEKKRQYDVVVRLKGGDVYVFGRGGEEGLHLQAAGLPFEVVPGISSSLAALSYAGIPITQRGLAQGFRVVTAHDKDFRLADLDFTGMARGRETLVFLMGLGKLPEIVAALLQAGAPRTRPAAVIADGTLPSQRVVSAPLADLPAAVARAGLCSPAIIVVGEVVALRERLNWFEARPLFGREVLLPVIGRGEHPLAEALRQKGAQVVTLPLGEIQALPGALDGLNWDDFDHLLFSSRQGVRCFLEALWQRGQDARALHHSRIACVGAATAEELARGGLCADFVASRSSGRTLAEELRPHLQSDERVLWLRAESTPAQIEQILAPCCRFSSRAVYRNRPMAADEAVAAWTRVAFDAVVLSSASMAERLVAALGSQALQGCAVFSIGEMTSQALERAGVHHARQAAQADYEGLLSAMLAAYAPPVE